MATTLKTVTLSVANRNGNSGAYTYRLRLLLNSTNTTANTANITVDFAVQGNNGWYYQSWADTDATFSISTNNGFSTTNNDTSGTGIRGHKSTAVGSYTTLSTWTGNVAYKSDGTLSASATVVYGWSDSGADGYVPVSSTISFSNIAITAITPSTVRYTGTAVGSHNTAQQTVQRNNSTSTGVQYYFRINVNETSYVETVDANGNVTRTSTLQLKLQFKNASNGSLWWASTAAVYQPRAKMYFNGSQVGSTGYVRTTSTSYTSSTSWADVPGVGTATVTVTHSPNGFATATCGFVITAGTGSYSGPYGPKAYSSTALWTITTAGGFMLQPPYTITYNSNGASSVPTPWTSTKSNITSATSKATLATAPTRSNSTKTLTKTLNYNANGGSVSPTSATSTATETTSYTFEKWHLDSISGTAYSAGASYELTWFETMVANWTEAVSVGSYSAITLPTPTWTIHKCLGWYTATSGGTKRGNAGASYTPTADIETVYAQWNSAANVNVSGTWKPAIKVWINDNGTWKEVSAIWVNVSGTWKKIA